MLTSDLLARLRILVVEDNAVNQEVAASLLRSRGHEVTVVDSGAKAIATFADRPFDVILMDIHMPEMDGVATAAAIRELPGGADCPTIAVTADFRASERERYLTAGMSGYLSKPFKAQDLFAIVEGQGTQMEPEQIDVTESISRPPPANVVAMEAAMRGAGAGAAVRGILDTFVSDALWRSAAIVAAVQSGQASDIQSTAHAFRSAAGSIGALPLADLLFQIELAGKECRLADARPLASAIQKECNAVIAYLRGLRAERPS